MAKVFASEVAMKAATKSLQIHGGAGYITEFPIERIFRDAKLTEIGEGPRRSSAWSSPARSSDSVVEGPDACVREQVRDGARTQPDCVGARRAR